MLSFEQILEKVNAQLDALKYPTTPRGLYEPIRYVLSMGGKRIRPVLLLLTYSLYRDDNLEQAMPAALGIETYHNYTLLHDDLMDKAPIRRGKPTVHKVWNDSTAILSGDTMLILAYRLMQQCNRTDVLQLFTRTAIEIGEGQQYDMNFENRMDVTEAEYIEMIRLKTSVLLACAAKMGAMLGQAPEADAEQLYHFAEQLGLAFQLQDDYLDVYGDPAVFGKKIGGDILCDKKTYLLINAWLRADETTREELTRWMGCPADMATQKIQAVTAIYNRLDIPQLCQQTIDNFFERARHTLSQINLPAEKQEQLWKYARTLLHRNK